MRTFSADAKASDSNDTRRTAGNSDDMPPRKVHHPGEDTVALNEMERSGTKVAIEAVALVYASIIARRRIFLRRAHERKGSPFGSQPKCRLARRSAVEGTEKSTPLQGAVFPFIRISRGHPRIDLIPRKLCPCSNPWQGIQATKELPLVLGCSTREDEDEEARAVCLRRTSQAVERRHDARR